jgi:hypothetical protein
MNEGEMCGTRSIDGEMAISIKRFLGKWEMAFVETSQEKRPLGRPMIYGREDNTKMDLKKTGCMGEGCIHLAQDRVQWWVCVKMVTNI